MATMPSRARRVLARAGIAVLPLVALFAMAQPAAACSGAVPDGVTEEQLLRKDLRHAYAAIVGRLIEVRPVGPQVPSSDSDGSFHPAPTFTTASSGFLRESGGYGAGAW